MPLPSSTTVQKLDTSSLLSIFYASLELSALQYSQKQKNAIIFRHIMVVYSILVRSSSLLPAENEPKLARAKATPTPAAFTGNVSPTAKL